VLLGSYRGLEKGLDPDNPKNLSRVVTIAGETNLDLILYGLAKTMPPQRVPSLPALARAHIQS